jgi:parvulin-like peptidyl-prolyl isomerase
MKLLLTLAIVGVSAATAVAQRPVPSHAAASGVREVARVNGVSLTSDRLDAAVSAMMPLESYHRSMPADKLAGLRRKALDQLVEDELRYQDGVNRGVTVTTAELRDGLAQVSRNYTSAAAFEAALRQAGTSLTDMRQEVRRALVVRKTFTQTVTNACQVNRAEAERYFAANPGRFVEPERLHVSAITIGVDPSSTPAQWAEAKVRAESALSQLRRGAAFEDTARKYSTDHSAASGGDMGFVHRGSLSGPLEQAVEHLSIGVPSDVVATLYGYHIVRVLEVRPPQKKTFDEVGAGLQKDLTTTRCADADAAWVLRLRARAQITMSV